VNELEEIGDYIARDDPTAAARWVRSLVQCAERAAVAPLAGRRVPELGRDDVRELLMRSYRIVYRVAEARIEILTVFEGHRRFPEDVTIDPSR
jgi:plasmid stabilization system protein ParE